MTGQPSRVTLYTARGCHLCDRARDTLAALRDELGFELREVDITGVPELEERYRELLPVTEIEGAKSFAYFVPVDQFRRALEPAQSPNSSSRL